MNRERAKVTEFSLKSKEKMDVKQAIDKIFNVVDAYVKAKSEDSAGGSKVVLTEKIGLAIQGIGIVQVFTGLEQLKEDWISRDDVKKAEWLQAFKERFDLNDEDLEKQIESFVGAILTLEDVFINLSLNKAG